MTTIYVDASAANNNGSGSIGDPLKTISAAIADATSGDTIIVADGTYYERLVISKPLTIQAATQWGAIIDGGYSGWNGTLPGTKSDWYRGQIDTSASNITLDGLYVRNSPRRGISLWNGGPGKTVSGIVVQNCKIENTYQMMLTALSTSGVVVDNCYFTNGPQARYAYLAGMVNDWPVCLGIGESGSDGLLSNYEMKNCTFYNTTGETISAGKGASNVSIHDNILRNIGTIGIYINWASQCQIYNNTIYISDGAPNASKGTRTGIGVASENQFDIGRYANSRNSDLKIYNNLIVGLGRPEKNTGYGISIAGNTDMSNAYIAHNTIGPMLFGGVLMENPGIRSRSNNIFENNVIYPTKNTIRSTSGITCRNNNWRTEGTAGAAAGIGDKYGDPDLVAPSIPTAAITKSNFHLSASSPGKNSGRASGIVTSDYRGVSRGATPDMGFFEDGNVTPSVTASITPSTTTPDAGDSVTLTDDSTITVGAIDEWLWQVSLDGGQTKSTIATTQNTSYTPANVGTYTIYLTVTDNDAPDSDTTSVVLVVGAPVVDPTDPGDDDEDETDTFSCAGNLLSNPSFDSNTTGWGTTNLSIARVSDPDDSSNYMLKVSNASSYPADFRQSGFSITSGTIYRLSFRAQTSPNTGSLLGTMSMIQNLSPFANLMDRIDIVISEESSQYTYLVEALASESNARLRFRPSYIASWQYILFDDFCLRPYSEVAAAFTVSDSTPSIGDTVTFTDTSTGDPYAWSWRVNGEIISTSAGPVTWTVPDEGVYTVELTVAGGDNTDTATETIAVEEWRDYSQRGLHRGLRRGMP